MRLVFIFSFSLWLCVAFFLLMLPRPSYAASLELRVNEAFQSVFGRLPTMDENVYWLGRVARKEKKTFEELQGAMFYQKARGSATGSPATSGTEARKQLTIDVLPLFAEIYSRTPSDSEKAWWRKRIACGELRSQAQLVASMKFHHGKGVGKGSEGICGGSAGASAQSAGSVRRAVAGIDSHPAGNQVRIGIYKTDGRAIHLTANGAYQIRAGSSTLATVGKDDVVQVSWSDGAYHIRGSGLELDPEQEVRLVPQGGSIMQIKSFSDLSKAFPGKNYNRFRGVIEVRKCDGCNELWAINELRTEHYLRGLAEASDNGPEEYLKALVVAARTYVLHHRVINDGRFQRQRFDIGSTSDDQIYRGYEYEAISPRLVGAIDTTKGTIVTDGEGDVPVSTVYFSDSDGRTRSAKEVWKTDRFPHLQRSVPDPHHAATRCIGHCVGMSAQGAYGFAKNEGWNFAKILTHYYNGIKIVKAY